MASSANYFVRELETKDGQTLRINQCEKGDVGCVVWDAAIVLTTYLETNDFLNSKGVNKLLGKHVLELGSGTGIVGIQAAKLGANVIITDLEEFVPLMELNIETNKDLITGKIEANVLNWGQDLSSFSTKPDVILMADCIYYEESLEPLVQTLKDLSSTDTDILCCYEERTEGKNPITEQKFFTLVKEHFTVEEIPMEKQDPVFRCEEIHILKFRKKTV